MNVAEELGAQLIDLAHAVAELQLADAAADPANKEPPEVAEMRAVLAKHDELGKALLSVETSDEYESFKIKVLHHLDSLGELGHGLFLATTKLYWQAFERKDLAAISKACAKPVVLKETSCWYYNPMSRTTSWRVIDEVGHMASGHPVREIMGWKAEDSSRRVTRLYLQNFRPDGTPAR